MTAVRSDEEAWEIAEDNRALGPFLVNQYLLDGIRLKHGKFVHKAPSWIHGQGIDIHELRADLEAVAWSALFLAAKRWEKSKGEFATLAGYTVGQALRQEIENHRRVGHHKDREGNPLGVADSGTKRDLKGDKKRLVQNPETPSIDSRLEAFAVGKPAATPPPDDRRTEASAPAQKNHLPSESAPKANDGVGFSALEAIAFLERSGEFGLAGDVRRLWQENGLLRSDLEATAARLLAGYVRANPNRFDPEIVKAANAVQKKLNRDKAKQRKKETE